MKREKKTQQLEKKNETVPGVEYYHHRNHQNVTRKVIRIALPI